MNKFLIITFFISVISFSTNAAVLQGKVKSLVNNSEEAIGKDSDYLLIENESSAGTCPTTEGLVIIRIPESESRAFSMALAAQLADKEVAVDVKESFTDTSGACKARWLKIIN